MDKCSLTGASCILDFTYGPDYQRVKTMLKNNSALVETRLYIGNYEKQIIAGGATREVHYVSGGNGLCAILVKEAGIVTPYYVYTDHLGSLLTITNSAGTVIAEQNFDAWGRKRNPVNWQYAGVPTTPAWLYRVYTSHEHLPHFTLINMNGRMYDPIQGRMLSPDNYVSTPFGTQGYNRYSYANNNPLSYVDPDGNNPLIIVGILVGGFLKGMQYGNQGKSFLGGFWRGAVFSGAGSALGMVGGGSFLANIAWGVGEGVVVNGLSNTLDGNELFKGAGISAIVGGAFAAISSGIESYKNWQDGYGFGTNTGRLNNMIEEFKNSIGTSSEIAQGSRAIGFVQKRYGLNDAAISFNASDPDFGSTSLNGNISIGKAAFESSSMLKATIIHEYWHSTVDRVFQSGSWSFITDRPAPWNYGDGVGAYASEIKNSGRMHISSNALSKVSFLRGNIWNYGATTLQGSFVVNPTWYAKGIVKSKWWYQIPKRF